MRKHIGCCQARLVFLHPYFSRWSDLLATKSIEIIEIAEQGNQLVNTLKGLSYICYTLLSRQKSEWKWTEIKLISKIIFHHSHSKKISGRWQLLRISTNLCGKLCLWSNCQTVWLQLPGVASQELKHIKIKKLNNKTKWILAFLRKYCWHL